MKRKLIFKIRETGSAFGEWPMFRIDTPDGATVATIHGAANRELGHLFAASPELLGFVTTVVNEQIARRESGDAKLIQEGLFLISKAKGQIP